MTAPGPAQFLPSPTPAAGSGERGGRMRARLHHHGGALSRARRRPQRDAPALRAVARRHVAAQPDRARRPAGLLVAPAAGRALRARQGADAGDPALGPQPFRGAEIGQPQYRGDPRSGDRHPQAVARRPVEAFHRRRARAQPGGEFPPRAGQGADPAVQPVVATERVVGRADPGARALGRAADRGLCGAVPDPAGGRRGGVPRRPGPSARAGAGVRRPGDHPGVRSRRCAAGR